MSPGPPLLLHLINKKKMQTKKLSYPVRCCYRRCVMCVRRWTAPVFLQSVWTPCHHDLCSRTSVIERVREISQLLLLPTSCVFLPSLVVLIFCVYILLSSFENFCLHIFQIMWKEAYTHTKTQTHTLNKMSHLPTVSPVTQCVWASATILWNEDYWGSMKRKGPDE